jgi:hypothetical protein
MMNDRGGEMQLLRGKAVRRRSFSVAARYRISHRVARFSKILYLKIERAKNF